MEGAEARRFSTSLRPATIAHAHGCLTLIASRPLTTAAGSSEGGRARISTSADIGHATSMQPLAGFFKRTFGRESDSILDLLAGGVKAASDPAGKPRLASGQTAAAENPSKTGAGEGR
jgi:hypothetical protein